MNTHLFAVPPSGAAEVASPLVQLQEVVTVPATVSKHAAPAAVSTLKAPAAVVTNTISASLPILPVPAKVFTQASSQNLHQNPAALATKPQAETSAPRTLSTLGEKNYVQ